MPNYYDEKINWIVTAMEIIKKPYGRVNYFPFLLTITVVDWHYEPQRLLCSYYTQKNKTCQYL